jgi:hypothetical protein
MIFWRFYEHQCRLTMGVTFQTYFHVEYLIAGFVRKCRIRTISVLTHDFRLESRSRSKDVDFLPTDLKWLLPAGHHCLKFEGHLSRLHRTSAPTRGCQIVAIYRFFLCVFSPKNLSDIGSTLWSIFSSGKWRFSYKPLLG